MSAAGRGVPASSTSRSQRVAEALRDRREAALLALPSVWHTAQLIAQRCREPSWIRTTVATLERFRELAGVGDLEALLAASRRDPVVAEDALRRFASALEGRASEQVAALALGAKVWWRVNGVRVPWRPLVAAPAEAVRALRPRAGLGTLALIGTGLTAEELVTVRVGDLGSLDEEAHVLPDPVADPLAVRYLDADSREERVTFLSPAARRAALARVTELGGFDRVAPSTCLVGPDDMAAARARDDALIAAGNAVNVALCRTTGDFFRSWGMPGARFEQRMSQAAGSGTPASRTASTYPERRPA